MVTFSLGDLRAFADSIALDIEEAKPDRTVHALTPVIYDTLCYLLPIDGDASQGESNENHDH